MDAQVPGPVIFADEDVVLVILLVVVLLTVLSYVSQDMNGEKGHVNESLNLTNNSSQNQSAVMVLERPPFLDEINEDAP